MSDEFNEFNGLFQRMQNIIRRDLAEKDKRLQKHLPSVSAKEVHCWRRMANRLPMENMLTDKKEKPLLLFHGTPCRFEEFYPLSHFGTLSAAREAALKSDIVLSGQPPKPNDFHETYYSWEDYCRIKNTRFIPVCLKMRRPLAAADIIRHDTEHYGMLVRNELEKETYSLLMKSQYPILRELGIAGVLMGHAQTEMPPVYQMIFNDPYKMTPEQIAQELRLETLFKVRTPYKNQLGKHSWNASINLTHLIYQRMIRFFERRGYDGIQYVNRCEDEGKLSYIVFRPEQVIRLDRDLERPCPKRRKNAAKEKRLNALEEEALARCRHVVLGSYERGQDMSYQKKLKEDEPLLKLRRASALNDERERS